MKSLLEIVKSVKLSASKHSPEILMGLGIVGMISTTVLAVKATPKAIKLIEEKKNESPTELSTFEKAETTWKCYIPAVVTGAVSIACLIGANSENAKRNAALVAAYKLSEATLNEYKDKVIEVIGEKKEKKVREAINDDKLTKNPVGSEIIIANGGNSRFYDVMGQRRFMTDIETIRKITNDLNLRMRDEMSVSLNDFYSEVGLSHIPIGDIIGWKIDNGYIEPEFDSRIDSDGVPCIVVDFRVRPDSTYSDLY